MGTDAEELYGIGGYVANNCASFVLNDPTAGPTDDERAIVLVWQV